MKVEQIWKEKGNIVYIISGQFKKMKWKVIGTQDKLIKRCMPLKNKHQLRNKT